jgi:hypothetical protein
MAQGFSNDQLAGYIRGLTSKLKQQQGMIMQLQGVVSQLASRPRSVAEEIDAIPGRRIEACLCGTVLFDATDLDQRGQPVIMQVPQDGPFIQTHYPMALWRPVAPDTTTNLNRWRPVSTFPLPDQVVDEDIIDILYEMQDGGNGRLFQNEARGPLLSRPDNIVPTPVPTLWSPNTAVNFIPTYLALTWDSDTPPTQGELQVTIPGYHIVNL